VVRAEQSRPTLGERAIRCHLLSEIMLQQTQVATVIAYYDASWRASRPWAPCRRPLDDVLKLWEGLGYYTARAPARAAQ